MTFKISTGTAVEARFRNSKRFFAGVVTKFNANGTFAVSFDWGGGRCEVVPSIARKDIRLPGKSKDEFDLNGLLLKESADKVLAIAYWLAALAQRSLTASII